MRVKQLLAELSKYHPKDEVFVEVWDGELPVLRHYEIERVDRDSGTIAIKLK